MRDLEDRRDLAGLVLPEVGRLAGTGDEWAPYRMLDADGGVVVPVAEYFAELQAADSAPSTLRSYGMDLLRWWRFLHAVGVPWNRATRVEARDFMRWMRLADKPVRTHWRHRDDSERQAETARAQAVAGHANPGTGKAKLGRKYSAASRAHAETVLRAFYDFHVRGETARRLLERFPARARPGRWPMTAASREEVLARIDQPR